MGQTDRAIPHTYTDRHGEPLRLGDEVITLGPGDALRGKIVLLQGKDNYQTCVIDTWLFRTARACKNVIRAPRHG